MSYRKDTATRAASSHANRQLRQQSGHQSGQRPGQRMSQSLIGKTVTGVISRPAGGGRECLLVLQFSDGSCFEFVSPAAQRTLHRGRHVQAEASSQHGADLQQLSFFPHDGNPATRSAPVC